MPVVPAPPFAAMPWMAMLWVPALSMCTPGMKPARSSMSLMPRIAICDLDIAEMLIGTLLIGSARRVAVTMISFSCGAPPAAIAGAASASRAASGHARRTRAGR